MQSITSTLTERFQRLENSKENKSQVKTKRKVNQFYEVCREIAEYTNLPVGVIMKWSKVYGKDKVYNLKGFLKDYPNKQREKTIGLAYAFLNEFKKKEENLK